MSTAAAPIITRFEDPGREITPPVEKVVDPKGPTAEERIAALERELTETKESQKVWETMATNSRPAPVVQKTEDTASVLDGFDFGKDEDVDDAALEGDTPEAMLDELTKLGPDALAKRGFMKRSDVVKLVREESRKAAATAATQAVARSRQSMTTEQQIMSEFPELEDKTSELFKATAAHVQAAVRIDPSAAKNPATVYLAARAAKAELGKSTQRGGREPQDDNDEPRRTERQDRRDQIDAQHGDRSRSRSRIETNSDADKELSEDALDLIGKLGIKPEDYKKYAPQRPAARGRR